VDLACASVSHSRCAHRLPPVRDIASPVIARPVHDRRGDVIGVVGNPRGVVQDSRAEAMFLQVLVGYSALETVGSEALPAGHVQTAKTPSGGAVDHRAEVTQERSILEAQHGVDAYAGVYAVPQCDGAPKPGTAVRDRKVKMLVSRIGGA
jgi:hypothetical protein